MSTLARNLRSNLRTLHNQKRTFLTTWRKFERWQDLEKAQKQDEWEEEQEKNFLKFEGGMYLRPERREDVLPAKDDEDKTREERGRLPFDYMAQFASLRTMDFSEGALRRYNDYEAMKLRQYDQRFLPERHLTLGPHLAAAHFIVHRGGRVKFIDNEKWYAKDESGKYKLPDRFVPGLKLEAIDASQTELMFEGLDNFVELSTLRLLSLANCPYANDWWMGKMMQFENSLELLDLSNCRKLSAQGVSGVRVLKHLRHLRLDGLEHVAGIGKVAVMLEEALPNLTIAGLNYDYSFGELDAETRLLSHPNVEEDAKGTISAVDEAGERYFLSRGFSRPIFDRVVVDDYDLPLMVGKILKEPPQLPLSQLDRLDELSDGRLKHRLLGSPSGHCRTEESQRILEFRAKKRKRKGDEIHPFLFSDEERKWGQQEEIEAGKVPEENLSLPPSQSV